MCIQSHIDMLLLLFFVVFALINFAFQIGLWIHKGNILLLTEKAEYQDSESVFLSERICIHKQEIGRGKSDSHVDDIGLCTMLS